MSVKLVTVAQTQWPHEAHLIKSVLVDHDIQATLKDEFSNQVHPGASWAMGGIKVQVQAEDAERAAALIQEFYSNTEPPANGSV